jgi:hypothetical protein
MYVSLASEFMGFIYRRVQVVEANSACLQGVDAQPLDCRHNMLHKFNSPNNDGFQRLTTRLDKYAKDAENTIRSKGEI